MRAHNVITDIICAGAVLGLGIWFALEHQARTRVDRDHTVLAQQVKQTSPIIARNRELTDLAGKANATQQAQNKPSLELLRLRGQVGLLRQQCKELENVRAANHQAHVMLESTDAAGPGSVATADYWPRDSWNFAGFGSPEAALQSSLCAANNGDVKAMLASATGDLRKMMEADLQGKSEEEASIKAMDEVSSFKSVRVLDREAQADDTTLLTVEIEDRTQTQTVKMLMKKVGNEWKISGGSQ